MKALRHDARCFCYFNQKKERVMSKLIPDDFLKDVSEDVKQRDDVCEKEKKDKMAENIRREKKQESENKKRRARNKKLYPKTLQLSREVYNWINNFWKELDPEKQKLINRLFPKPYNFYLCGLQVYLDYPTWLYWNRYGRKYRHGPLIVRVARNPEELAKEGGYDFLLKFHTYLYSGEVWDDLKLQMTKRLEADIDRK
jgi:hypothetical protein